MLQCPNCQSEIGEADFNVSTDLAYCRNCRSELSYSELRSAVSGADFTALECPQHVKVEDMGGRTEITYKRIQPAVWFLIPFTCLWSGISVGLGLIMPLMKNEFDPTRSLFMIPFLIGTVILIGVILFLLLSKLRIILDGDQSEVTLEFGPFTWRRRFDFSNVKSVTIRASSLKINDVAQSEVCLIRNDGDPIAFGCLMKEESRQYVAKVIASRLTS